MQVVTSDNYAVSHHHSELQEKIDSRAWRIVTNHTLLTDRI